MSGLIKRLRNSVNDGDFSEILTGSIWVLCARVTATALAMLTNIVIARYYGAEVMGIVAIVSSFVSIATIFTVFGTNTSILRLIPEHISKHSVASAFKVYRKTQYFVAFVSIVTGGLIFLNSSIIAQRLFSKPHLSIFFQMAAAFVMINSLMQLNTQAVRGLRLIRTFALMQLLPSLTKLLILLIATFYIFNVNNPIYALFSSWFVTALAGIGIMEYVFKRQISPGLPVLPTPLKTILTISLPMLMAASMSYIMAQAGVIMLGVFRSEAEVGYYAVAVKLATLTSFLHSAINSMTAPRFSELFHTGRMSTLFDVATKTARLIFWTTTPILLGLLVFGRSVLSILFGESFAVAYPALALLSLGQFVNSIAGCTGIFMNMTGHHNTFKNIMLGAAIINIGLNVLLTPQLGITGAALAAMASLIFWNIYTLLYIKHKYGHNIGYLPLAWKQSASGAS